VTNTNNNGRDNDTAVREMIAQATAAYEYAIGQGHGVLRKGTLDAAFRQYTNAVGYAWCVTLLLSDDDSEGLAFWRHEMSNAQQLCTALAVLLKARGMVLPTRE
jgi:hypothetical protein